VVEVLLDPTTLDHLKTVTSLIERRRVSTDEVLLLANKILRQHRIGKGKITGYAERNSNREPP